MIHLWSYLITHFYGGLAQLARAPALHAGGHRFDSDILHHFCPISLGSHPLRMYVHYILKIEF